MKFVIIGLSVTSSWGNGHATTYRALIQALDAAGHEVVFLERDVPWYAENRDMPTCNFCSVHLYDSVDDLKARFRATLEQADCVILGSYTPDAPVIANWLFAQELSCPVLFYDIDTPVTLSALEQGACEYLEVDAVHRFDAYLSFSGGRALDVLAERYGSPHPEAFYCSADPDQYYHEATVARWALGYLGTYSEDRQPTVDELLTAPAREMPRSNFVVAGPQYPELEWPHNCDRLEHVPPRKHRNFYNKQCYTLNVTRADMRRYGWSPSVRLFEAAACGVPVISDWWEGLDELFVPDREILIARGAEDVLGYLKDIPENERRAIGRRASERVRREHGPDQRAAQLVDLLHALTGTRANPQAISA